MSAIETVPHLHCKDNTKCCLNNKEVHGIKKFYGMYKVFIYFDFILFIKIILKNQTLNVTNYKIIFVPILNIICCLDTSVKST